MHLSQLGLSKPLLCISLLVSTLVLPLQAQNYNDALRYSEQIPSGTARYNGMAGAFTALGGDVTAAHYNPAGLGWFQTGEFNFSLAYLDVSSNANYIGTENDISRSQIIIPNISLVVPLFMSSEESKEYKNLNLLVSFHRDNTFSRSLDLLGNNSTSMLSFYKERATGYTTGNLSFDPYAYNAYESYLIESTDPDNPNETNYVSAIDLYESPSGDQFRQRDLVEERGYTNRYTIGFGGALNEHFSIGITGNIRSVYYQYSRRFTENNRSPVQYSGHSLAEKLETRGVGLSLNIGALYKGDNGWNYGLSLQAPSMHYLNDEFSETFTARIFNINYEPQPLAPGEFDYRLQSPARVALGISKIFGERGLISFDYEGASYGNANFVNNFDGSLERNDAIKEILTTAHIFRVGAEKRYGKDYLRAGAAYYSTPYQSDFTFNINNSDRLMASLGYGNSSEDVYFDMGLQFWWLYHHRAPFTLTSLPERNQGASITDFNVVFTATLGFRFY